MASLLLTSCRDVGFNTRQWVLVPASSEDSMLVELDRWAFACGVSWRTVPPWSTNFEAVAVPIVLQRCCGASDSRRCVNDYCGSSQRTLIVVCGNSNCLFAKVSTVDHRCHLDAYRLSLINSVTSSPTTGPTASTTKAR